MFLIPKRMKSLSKLAGEPGRWATDAVQVTAEGDRYTVTATSNKRGAIVTGVVQNGPHPCSEAVAAAPNSATAALIDSEQFARALDGCHRGRGQPATYDAAAVSLSADAVTIGTTRGGVATLPTVKGQHPPLGDIIPKGTPKLAVHVEPKQFAELLRVAADFANDDGSVTLEFRHPDHPIVVRTSTTELQFTGILATMRRDDE